ncbi:hypothetical protein BJ508DRAFT_328879, partial [Ascobolus immersus RN42]
MEQIQHLRDRADAIRKREQEEALQRLREAATRISSQRSNGGASQDENDHQMSASFRREARRIKRERALQHTTFEEPHPRHPDDLPSRAASPQIDAPLELDDYFDGAMDEEQDHVYGTDEELHNNASEENGAGFNTDRDELMEDPSDDEEFDISKIQIGPVQPIRRSVSRDPPTGKAPYDPDDPDDPDDPYEFGFDYRNPHRGITVTDLLTVVSNDIHFKFGIPRRGMDEIRTFIKAIGNIWEVRNMATKRIRGKTITVVPGVEATATDLLRRMSGVLLIPGPKNPKDFDSFLVPFLDELKELEDGIMCYSAYADKEVMVRAFFMNLSSDTQARVKVLHTLGPAAKRFCEFCKAVSIFNNGMYSPFTCPIHNVPQTAINREEAHRIAGKPYFDLSVEANDDRWNPEQRTHESFLRAAAQVALGDKEYELKSGVKGKTCLVELRATKLSDSFSPCNMHATQINWPKYFFRHYRGVYEEARQPLPETQGVGADDDYDGSADESAVDEESTAR